MPNVSKKPTLQVGDTESEGLVRISASKLKTYRMCHKKAEYKYIQKLQKKVKAVQLRRGGIIHECLEYHYTGRDYKEVIEAAKKELQGLLPEEQLYYGDLIDEIYRIMRGYTITWRKNDENWEVIGCEIPVDIRIPGTNIVMVVILDMVIEDEQGIWIVEHKTHKNLPDEEYRMFDVQSAIYIWAIPLILEAMGLDKNKFMGLIFDYIRTKAPTEPEYLEKSGRLSARKIDTDRATIIATCKKYGLDPHDYKDMIKAADGRSYFDRYRLSKSKALLQNVIADAVATGSLIPYIKHFSRNPGMHCTWGCEFKELCLCELYGNDTTFLRKADFEIKAKEEEERVNGQEENS